MREATLTKILNAARKRGAVDADVVLAHSANLSVEAADGKLETLILAESVGVGVRVFTGERRMGFAYASARSVREALEADAVVDAAWQNAQVVDADACNVLPEEAGVSEEDWSQQDFDAIPVADKIDFCLGLEQQTLAADPRVSRVQEASYSDTRGEFVIANSLGLRRVFRNAYCSCSVVAAASEAGSDSEVGWEFDFGRTFDALRPDWVAVQCAAHAAGSLGGKPCPTRTMPIVLDNRVATEFLSVLGPALMATHVLKGKSLYAGKVGQPIAADLVTVIDQNDLESGLNRAPFDAEGALAQRTVLIDHGVLRGFLHNAYTARRMDEKTTANAGRGGRFRSVPEVVASNCYLEPGTRTQEQLLDLAGDGFLVTRAMGVHTADPVSGDFSLGAAGFLIEGGRKGRAVRGVTIAGNLKALFGNVAATGNDLRFFGSYGSPSILVSHMAVGGQ